MLKVVRTVTTEFEIINAALLALIKVTKTRV
jgi:hypothetical protein